MAESNFKIKKNFAKDFYLNKIMNNYNINEDDENFLKEKQKLNKIIQKQSLYYHESLVDKKITGFVEKFIINNQLNKGNNLSKLYNTNLKPIINTDNNNFIINTLLMLFELSDNPIINKNYYNNLESEKKITMDKEKVILSQSSISKYSYENSISENESEIDNKEIDNKYKDNIDIINTPPKSVIIKYDLNKNRKNLSEHETKIDENLNSNYINWNPNFYFHNSNIWKSCDLLESINKFYKSDQIYKNNIKVTDIDLCILILKMLDNFESDIFLLKNNYFEINNFINIENYFSSDKLIKNKLFEFVNFKNKILEIENFINKDYNSLIFEDFRFSISNLINLIRNKVFIYRNNIINSYEFNNKYDNYNGINIEIMNISKLKMIFDYDFNIINWVHYLISIINLDITNKIKNDLNNKNIIISKIIIDKLEKITIVSDTYLIINNFFFDLYKKIWDSYLKNIYKSINYEDFNINSLKNDIFLVKFKDDNIKFNSKLLNDFTLYDNFIPEIFKKNLKIILKLSKLGKYIKNILLKKNILLENEIMTFFEIFDNLYTAEFNVSYNNIRINIPDTKIIKNTNKDKKLNNNKLFFKNIIDNMILNSNITNEIKYSKMDKDFEIIDKYYNIKNEYKFDYFTKLKYILKESFSGYFFNLNNLLFKQINKKYIIKFFDFIFSIFFHKDTNNNYDLFYTEYLKINSNKKLLVFINSLKDNENCKDFNYLIKNLNYKQNNYFSLIKNSYLMLNIKIEFNKIEAPFDLLIKEKQFIILNKFLNFFIVLKRIKFNISKNFINFKSITNRIILKKIKVLNNEFYLFLNSIEYYFMENILNNKIKLFFKKINNISYFFDINPCLKKLLNELEYDIFLNDNMILFLEIILNIFNIFEDFNLMIYDYLNTIYNKEDYNEEILKNIEKFKIDYRNSFGFLSDKLYEFEYQGNNFKFIDILTMVNFNNFYN